MDKILAGLVALLIVAVLVALAARRLKLPYTVGLVATGIVLAWTHILPAPPLTHDLIYLIILPPLLFEAECRTPEQMRLANAFCRYLELAEAV